MIIYIEASLDGLLEADDADPAWRDTLIRDLRELRGKLDQVELVRSRMMDGDDSQMRRMHADGIKLSAILDQAIREHIAGNHTGSLPQDPQADIDLLASIRSVIESENWWQNLQSFKRHCNVLLNARQCVRQQVHIR